MSVKPILFNTNMVRAILDDRKTVTRRIVKTHPAGAKLGACKIGEIKNDKIERMWFWGDKPGILTGYARPPYQLGDILYVRETWQKTYINDGTTHPTNFKYEYIASDEQRTVYRWNPSIHMPKEAARIWLKVTNVRAERLQDITEEQAVKEGCCTFRDKIGSGKFDDVIEFDLTAREAFAELWNGTLKKDSNCTWAHDPWVWVIEFERCEKPQEVEQ